MGRGQRDHRQSHRRIHRPSSRTQTRGGLLGAPWLAAKKTESKAGTIDLIDRVLRIHVKPKWGMREVQSITHDEVQVRVSELAETKSASLTRRAFFTLSVLVKKAKAEKCIHDNPCDDIALPRMIPKKHVYLSVGQLLALADASGWHRPIVLALGLCGLRWGELAGLQVGDVDFERQRIHVLRTVSEIRDRFVVGTPKTGETRTVFFFPVCSDHALRGRARAVSRPICFSPTGAPARIFGARMDVTVAIGSAVRSTPSLTRMPPRR